MKNSKRINSVLILLALAILSVSAQAQQQPSRVMDRQIGVAIKQLDRSSARFRASLNGAILNGTMDQTRPENDINGFKTGFVNAVAQFRIEHARKRATVSGVENILQKASLIDGFMTRNPLRPQVQNDWSAVRRDLSTLANVYGLSWQWNRQTFPAINSNSNSNSNTFPRLSDTELAQLIQRIDTGGDTFRVSLTDAFAESRYDRTTGESNMNNSVRGFKNATDQLRNRFDARQPVNEYVEQVLARATPIDTYMRANRLTDRAQSDWATGVET